MTEANQAANQLEHDISSDQFDRGIEPAETAARKEREGNDYKQTSEQPEGSIDTTAGQTISNEGLANNYAIEPEMYVEEPGDLSDKKA